MQSRFATVGYLFAHWGIGITVGGALSSNRFTWVCWLGLILHLIGQVLVGILKKKEYKYMK